MKVSTEIDNNFGYEKITQLVDNIPLINVVVLLVYQYKVNINQCGFLFAYQYVLSMRSV
jgi:hypothetical protein